MCLAIKYSHKNSIENILDKLNLNRHFISYCTKHANVFDEKNVKEKVLVIFFMGNRIRARRVLMVISARQAPHTFFLIHLNYVFRIGGCMYHIITDNPKIHAHKLTKKKKVYKMYAM